MFYCSLALTRAAPQGTRVVTLYVRLDQMMPFEKYLGT